VKEYVKRVLAIDDEMSEDPMRFVHQGKMERPFGFPMFAGGDVVNEDSDDE